MLCLPATNGRICTPARSEKSEELSQTAMCHSEGHMSTKHIGMDPVFDEKSSLYDEQVSMELCYPGQENPRSFPFVEYPNVECKTFGWKSCLDQIVYESTLPEFNSEYTTSAVSHEASRSLRDTSGIDEQGNSIKGSHPVFFDINFDEVNCFASTPAAAAAATAFLTGFVCYAYVCI